MSIPKIIHYCWFGPKPIPELELKCIASWKLFFPDYTFMFWNEKTFDVNQYLFAKEAYEKNYYAFVSDFVRAFALNEYGGLYFDTDLEVLSNFEELLVGKKVVLGFENKSFIGTAMMATIPNHYIFNDFVEYYKNISFVNVKGDVQIIANPSILADILKKSDIKLNGEEQYVDGIQVYRREHFFPKKLGEGKFNLANETSTIHHFEGSWLTARQKRRGTNIFWIEVCRPFLRNCKSFLLKIIGQEKTKEIENKIRNWLK